MDMKKTMLTGSGILLAILLFLAINSVSNTLFKSARVDLTEHRLYTLSEGTRNILSGLQEPVTLQLFLSEKAVNRLPGISSYALRVKEFLQEYARVAGSMLDVRFIDPEPFSGDEDRAVGYGLQGVPLDDGESMLYFGLVGTNSTDGEQNIPFFPMDRQEYLEYDLTKLIYQLSDPRKPRVGLLSSLPLAGGPPTPPYNQPAVPWTIYNQIKQFFDVETLEMSLHRIPESIDILMLVHPKNLDEAALYAIDQFVLGGGRVLALVDPYSEADPANAQAMGMGMIGANVSDLNRLMKAWGVQMLPGQVAADLSLASRVRDNRDNRNRVIDYPIWMQLQTDQINDDDIITSDIGNLMLPTAGILEKEEKASTTITPLFYTSENSASVTPERIGMNADPEDILRNYQPLGRELMLAVRIIGPAVSAFADGSPVTENSDGDKELQKHLQNSSSDINVIVVADTDFLLDRFWVQVQNLLGTQIAIPTASNGAFVINALDNLSGSSDLISVRNRGSFSRPFTLVQDIRQHAEIQYRQKEQELISRLNETEANLSRLQNEKSQDEQLLLSEQQQIEVQRFTEEKLRIRKELREVRHELQKDIEKLGTWMKFINIGLIPLLLVLVALIAAILRRRHRQHFTRIA